MNACFDIELSFQPLEGANTKVFEDFLEHVLEELDNIGVQADLTATLAKYTAIYSLPAENYSDDALIKALSDLRTALLAVECATPDWPTAYEVLGTRSVRTEELVGL
jgi:hypothetical protein